MVIETLQSRSKVVDFLKQDVPPYRASRRRGNTSLVPMICRISSIDSRICLLCHLCLLAVLRSKVSFYEQRGHVFLISAAQEITFLIFFDTLGDQFLGVFRCLGTHFRVRGPIWMISGAIVRFSWKKWVHRPPPKGSILGLFSIFFFIVFFGVLSFLDFYAFACPKGPFWLSFRLLFESPGLFKKQLKVCNCRRFSRFGPFEMRLFLKIWSWVAFDVDFFRFFRFLMIFGVSNLIDFRAKITIKKKSQKRVSGKNRKRPGKIRIGGWAP